MRCIEGASGSVGVIIVVHRVNDSFMDTHIHMHVYNIKFVYLFMFLPLLRELLDCFCAGPFLLLLQWIKYFPFLCSLLSF